ncbi:hypothetical protein GKZ68_20450 (plasmid) [Hymenobacter sp. BRD128]|uniref:hypothetical protein n=1 Tax=Hymenobacter sp. BRD128 TaxID=2675878 RepID=UPI001567233E|nr:hypothetical protein [Hymenobacter sp. BRD128]QKG59055.1 hypothetical protein GKZ68_20450 [Hymenobacter sp. BRD128]
MFTSPFKASGLGRFATDLAEAGRDKAGELLLQAQGTAQRLPLLNPRTRGEKLLALLLVMMISAQEANAQAGTTIVDQLKNIRTLIYNIVNVLFIVFLSVALIRTAKKFMSGEPDAMSSIGWLIGGVLLWFGFTYFKKDIQGSMTSSAGGGLGGQDGQ